LNSEVFLNEALWREHVSGWEITDCVVRDLDVVYLCTRQKVPQDEASLMHDHDIQTRLIALNLTKPAAPYGARTLTGYNKPVLGSCLLPVPQGLLVAKNSSGQVNVLGGGKFPDEAVSEGGWPMIQRVKCLFDYAYAVGIGRSVYKRVAIGEWQPVDDGLPDDDVDTHQGFNDVDAFSTNDMYAVGGHGDVWHYDGKTWAQQGFPSNVQLATVTCAGDGNVYVTGEGGSLWVGNKSTWKRLYEGDASIMWNDVLWFDGKLWLASDYQLRIWQDGKLETIEHEGEQLAAYGHMDARDGLLVVASPDSVWGYDGKQWRSLVAPYLD